MITNLFRRKPDASSAARALAMQGHDKHRAKVRAVCDDMRERLGLPPAEWPERG